MEEDASTTMTVRGFNQLLPIHHQTCNPYMPYNDNEYCCDIIKIKSVMGLNIYKHHVLVIAAMR